MIVDDDVIMREMLKALLDGMPFDLAFAEDGLEGLALAREIRPDIIILDAMMPNMNGFEVCRQVRADPEIAEVAVIMVTALDNDHAKISGLEAGVDDFLSKPLNRLELELRVRNLHATHRYRQLLEERARLKAALAELKTSNLQLHTLSQQMLEAQENERRQVAIDLHDEIGQLMTGLKLVLDEKRTDTARQVMEAREITQELFTSLRTIILNLRPGTLDDFGLFAALDELFKRYTKQTQIEVRHNIHAMDERRFTRGVETGAFRVIQEALTNCARHAGVQTVTVMVDENLEGLEVLIRDEGKGIDLENVQTGLSSGLAGMAERVQLAGGRFELCSKPGEGTEVRAIFNLTAREIET